MNVLLDECVPRKLKVHFRGHFTSTVVEEGWSGKKNGELLRLAEKKFDVFLTVDQNLHYQQSIRKFKVAIILLLAKSNDIDTLKTFIPQVLKVLNSPLELGKIFKVHV